MEKHTIYHYDTKSDRAWRDKDILEKKGKKIITVTNLLETLSQTNWKIDFLVNISGYEWLVKIREEHETLREKIWSIHIHSCLSWNLFLRAKEEGYLWIHNAIKNKIISTITLPATTPDAIIFLDNI